MAKFTNRNIEFKDNQRAIFGDEDDSAIYWDGNQLIITTVVSGITPTQDYHLATKHYVDALPQISNTDDLTQGTTNLYSQWDDATGGINYAGGNVGIGTDSPNEQLEITGNLRMPQTTTGAEGIIYKDHIPFIHDFAKSGTTGRNFFAGINAGNFTMTGATGDEASNLVGIGRLALTSNTTGYFNVAVGSAALQDCTTGNRNTAVGGLALEDVTTGQQNFGLGYGAGGSITTGSYNFAIGSPALGGVTTQSSNIAIGNWTLHTGTVARSIGIGQSSGRYLSDGSTAVTSVTNSIYIGHEIKVGEATPNNEVVIGYRTVGLGDDSVIIGNDDTTKTALKGSVGIGTDSPSELLDINSDAIRVRTSQTPPSSSAPGTAGMICWDSDYIYICVATDTWKRSAITTW